MISAEQLSQCVHHPIPKAPSILKSGRSNSAAINVQSSLPSEELLSLITSLSSMYLSFIYTLFDTKFSTKITTKLNFHKQSLVNFHKQSQFLRQHCTTKKIYCDEHQINSLCLDSSRDKVVTHYLKTKNLSTRITVI